jgi:hypothetical protein
MTHPHQQFSTGIRRGGGANSSLEDFSRTAMEQCATSFADEPDWFVDELGPGRSSAETSWRWRQAGTRKDIELARSLVAPDVVLRLPATDQWALEGEAEVIDMLGVVFRTLDFLEFQNDIGDETTRALRLFGSVHGVKFEESHFLWFDEQHRVTEAVFCIRPALGLAAITDALGPPLLSTNHSYALGRAAHYFLRTATRVVAAVDRHVIPRGRPHRAWTP